jgi:hypothetical protein
MLDGIKMGVKLQRNGGERLTLYTRELVSFIRFAVSNVK